MDRCICMTPPFHSSDFDSDPVGIDDRQGRFGEVSIEACTKCNQRWLRYFVEYEGFSNSARWYRGCISDKEAKEMTPHGAIEVLERLDWYYYGGSYFATPGIRGSGELYIDL